MLSQHGDETLKAFKRRSMHEILFSITWAPLLSLIREFRILFWENWFNLVGGLSLLLEVGNTPSVRVNNWSTLYTLANARASM